MSFTDNFGNPKGLLGRVVIEGTVGCKGYKDYFFHFKGFLIGCVYTTVMALLFAGIDYALLRFIIWR